MFQSTHPHGVRRFIQLSYTISSPKVSIHAPTRGATVADTGKITILISFNPRTHTGCDPHVSEEFFAGSSFNPRTHTGCDTDKGERIIIEMQFQSTHPHGVRPRYSPLSVMRSGFNPRTHTGCDKKLVYNVGLGASRFNPRTHTGCDPSPKVPTLFFISFQSTHPHGVRQFQTIQERIIRAVSIHAPTRGATKFVIRGNG